MEDDKISTPKVAEFRNKFEKFGGQVARPPVRRPNPPFVKVTTSPGVSGGPGAGAGAGAGGGGSEMEKACKEAQELAKELQRQLGEMDKMRTKERQQFSDEVLKIRREMSAEIEDSRCRNAAVFFSADEFLSF